MTRQIILDTETTGLSPEYGHRIIEIGCVEMIDRFLTGNNFHFYLNPERDIDPGAQAVHGISRKFLSDKPLFREKMEEFLDYMKYDELIIHNAPFDVKFLNHELKLASQSFLITDRCGILDTLTLARRKHPGKPNDLRALCRRYEVNDTREVHGALVDAGLLAQVYLRMTGGQEELFSEHTKNNAHQRATTDMLSVNSTRIPLPIIRAAEEEREAHEKFLKKHLKKEVE